MNFKSTMLSKISQMKKDKNHMILLIGEILNKKQQMNKNNKQTSRCKQQYGGY